LVDGLADVAEDFGVEFAACEFDEPPLPILLTTCPEISVAPHAHLSPCLATGLPSMIMVGSPVTMTVVP
jgi:hypothetical protein